MCVGEVVLIFMSFVTVFGKKGKVDVQVYFVIYAYLLLSCVHVFSCLFVSAVC